jgi:cyclic pyranopterin phosphate synthase
MFDGFNRRIHYLRISVTDRCNLRCIYCMPEEGIRQISHSQVLRYEEIACVAEEAVKLGIDKIRITGGEPLVRRGLASLVRMLSRIGGIRDLSMTTNGILLSQYAGDLKHAGLDRVNISLDTLDSHRYRVITRGGEVANVLRGIRVAKKAGLDPIKINCVVDEGTSLQERENITAFGIREGLEVRFIRRMNLETGCFTTVEGGDGGNCVNCNRLRLTADGKLRPCLFSNLEFDIRRSGIREALIKAIGEKPEKGTVNTLSSFYNVGG